MPAIESPAEKIRFDVFEVDLRAGDLLTLSCSVSFAAAEGRGGYAGSVEARALAG